jgi:Flp pilus assembly protein TadB
MGWAQATALIVPVFTIVGAVIGVGITYALNQRAGRRERQARAFAEALAVIEDYANMPYRIGRRQPEARHEISVKLDKIQSRIAFQHAWLQIEARAAWRCSPPGR